MFIVINLKALSATDKLNDDVCQIWILFFLLFTNVLYFGAILCCVQGS